MKNLYRSTVLVAVVLISLVSEAYAIHFGDFRPSRIGWLAPLHLPQASRLTFAQYDPEAERDLRGSQERARLLEELSRIRGRRQDGPTQDDVRERFSPPLPVRRRPIDVEPVAATSAPVDRISQPANLEKTIGHLIIMGFSGTETGDDGVKTVRGLIQQGLIAGVFVGRDNVVSRNQIRDMLKTFSNIARLSPIISMNETGGDTSALTFEKGFAPWPMQKDVSAKDDPNYAHSTYRTLASNLEYLGITMNFGPKIAGQGPDSFSADPLKNAVFAKTFILGHAEAGVTPVPIVDGAETTFRSLKTLLVSYQDTAIAAYTGTGPLPPTLKSDLINGARFCLVGSGAEEENAVSYLKQGCDALVFTKAGSRSGAIRQKLSLLIANAVGRGELSSPQLEASVARVQTLRQATSSASR